MQYCNGLLWEFANCTFFLSFYVYILTVFVLCVDFLSCDQDEDSPTIIFVSKLFTVDKQTLPTVHHQVR